MVQNPMAVAAEIDSTEETRTRNMLRIASGATMLQMSGSSLSEATEFEATSLEAGLPYDNSAHFDDSPIKAQSMQAEASGIKDQLQRHDTLGDLDGLREVRSDSVISHVSNLSTPTRSSMGNKKLGSDSQDERVIKACCFAIT